MSYVLCQQCRTSSNFIFVQSDQDLLCLLIYSIVSIDSVNWQYLSKEANKVLTVYDLDHSIMHNRHSNHLLMLCTKKKYP